MQPVMNEQGEQQYYPSPPPPPQHKRPEPPKATYRRRQWRGALLCKQLRRAASPFNAMHEKDAENPLKLAA